MLRQLSPGLLRYPGMMWLSLISMQDAHRSDVYAWRCAAMLAGPLRGDALVRRVSSLLKNAVLRCSYCASARAGRFFCAQKLPCGQLGSSIASTHRFRFHCQVSHSTAEVAMASVLQKEAEGWANGSFQRRG
jgi:hypothetical protein